MEQSGGITGQAAVIEAARSATLDAARTEAVHKQHARGKLTARERIDLLVDEGSFREFGALVAPTRDTSYSTDLDAPADGVVTGRARVDGRPVALASFDFTVAGGSNGAAGGLKMFRLVEHALREGCPLVMLLDGGGHRLQEGLDSWHFAWGFGLFERMVELSGWVPMVSAMLGPNFGGPTNFAALSDFVVMVRGISSMGIAGPALVKTATGEDISKEDLGGAEIQAARGVCHLAVDSELEACDAVRLYLSYLPSNCQQPTVRAHLADPSDQADRVGSIVPANPRRSYDVIEVVEAIADRDSVFEIRPTNAPNVVTAFVRLGGRPAGVIANQPLHLSGALDSAACEKAAHFISVCDAFGLPLVYLIDVPGFLGGRDAEESALARRSGRMLFELGQATVPRCSVVMRKGFGAGYIAMCGGRSFSADVAVAWPTAEIAATAVESVLDIAFRREIAAAPDAQARREELADEFRRHISPLAAAQGFGVDDTIPPESTRLLLIEAFERLPARRVAHGPAKAHPISPV